METQLINPETEIVLHTVRSYGLILQETYNFTNASFVFVWKPEQKLGLPQWKSKCIIFNKRDEISG